MKMTVNRSSTLALGLVSIFAVTGCGSGNRAETTEEIPSIVVQNPQIEKNAMNNELLQEWKGP